MNLGKLTNIVLGAIKSRKDKTNKITQLAMAINGTYVDDTTYVDDKILWLFGENTDEFSIHYSNISKIVEKINSLKSGIAGLILTEKLASKFSILAGLTGVEILDFSQKEVYDIYGSQFAALGVDITGLVLAVEFIIGELDNNTKFTYNGVEYTLLPADEEPTVIAPMFDSVDLTGETVSSSQFQLGDNIIYNATDNLLISPYVIFLTAEQYSKFLITGAFVDNEALQRFENELLPECLTPVSDMNGYPFTAPQNAAYVCLLNGIVAEVIGSALATSITITYDGVNYVYDSTNVLITTPEEEPDVPTLYSAVFNTKTGITTSEYTLGDNLVISDETVGTLLSPALLLLTSELAQNMSVSVTTTDNNSSLIPPDVILNIVDSMSVKEITNFAGIDISSISSFISEHNITHVMSFMGIYDCFAPSIQGTSDEAISSFTITYNGNLYTYGFDNFTFNIGQ